MANITFSTSALVVHFTYLVKNYPWPSTLTPEIFCLTYPLLLPILLHPRKQLTLVYDIRSTKSKDRKELNRNNRWRSQVVTKKINNPCRKIPRESKEEEPILRCSELTGLHNAKKSHEIKLSLKYKTWSYKHFFSLKNVFAELWQFQNSTLIMRWQCVLQSQQDDFSIVNHKYYTFQQKDTSKKVCVKVPQT